MGAAECWHFFDGKQRFEYKSALEWRATEKADDSVMFSTESTGGLELLLAEYQILSNWKTSYLVFVRFNYQRKLKSISRNSVLNQITLKNKPHHFSKTFLFHSEG